MLDALILLGVAITLLKGVDFVIRPHQRKAIQEFLEDMTLRIDTFNFRDISGKFGTPEALFCFTVLAYFEFILIVVLVLVIQTPQWEPGGQLDEAFGKEGRAFQLLAVGISFVTLFAVWRWPLPEIMRFVVGAGRSRVPIALRFVAFLLAGYVFLFLGLTGVEKVEALLGLVSHDSSLYDVRPTAAYYIAILLLWPAFTIFWVVTQAVGALLQVGTFYVRWMFVFLRSVLWRVIEYEKGAVAAVVIIATIVLTLFKELH